MKTKSFWRNYYIFLAVFVIIGFMLRAQIIGVYKYALDVSPSFFPVVITEGVLTGVLCTVAVATATAWYSYKRIFVIGLLVVATVNYLLLGFMLICSLVGDYRSVVLPGLLLGVSLYLLLVWPAIRILEYYERRKEVVL